LSYKPDTYTKNLRQGKIKCPFCDLSNQKIVKEYKHMYVIENLYPYQYWEEGIEVKDHFLLFPKRHLVSLGEFNQKEKTEYIDLTADYEAQGYNLYIRALKNPTKSIDHHHTHLFKIGTKKARLYLFLKKPYFIIRK